MATQNDIINDEINNNSGTLTIHFAPATVDVNDDRDQVAGIQTTGDLVADIIPPEGDSVDCWLGEQGNLIGRVSDDDVLFEQLLEALKDAMSATKPGTIEVSWSIDEDGDTDAEWRYI